MNKIKKSGLGILLMSLVMIASQFIMTTSAFADPTYTDLNIQFTEISHYGRRLQTMVCNQGPASVSSFTLDLAGTHFSVDSVKRLSVGSDATDPGSVTNDGVWTGTLDYDDDGAGPHTNQCIQIDVLANTVGNPGDVLTFTPTITSSVLSDGVTPNVDTNTLNNTNNSASYTLVTNPDLSMSTRLLSGSTNYEITMTNVGAGDYLASSFDSQPGIYFMIPEGTTFAGITDTTPSDNLELGHTQDNNANPACEDFGAVSDLAAYLGIDLSQYHGRVEHCQFNVTDGNFSSGSSAKFQIDLNANTEFVSGQSTAIGVAISHDQDTGEFISSEFSGEDFFGLPINNIFHLVYDDSELIPTFTPCSGQGETTTVDDACFNISFNKTIYDPSDNPQFTINSLSVTGGGHVSTFVKNGPNSWTVHVTGMTLGATTTLSLTPAAVQDLSAIANGTQVLGINTIRYTAAGSAATGTTSGATSGTLPKTGKDTDPITPMVLLVLGLALILVSKNKKFATSDK